MVVATAVMLVRSRDFLAGSGAEMPVRFSRERDEEWHDGARVAAALLTAGGALRTFPLPN